MLSEKVPYETVTWTFVKHTKHSDKILMNKLGSSGEVLLHVSKEVIFHYWILKVEKITSNVRLWQRTLHTWLNWIFLYTKQMWKTMTVQVYWYMYWESNVHMWTCMQERVRTFMLYAYCNIHVVQLSKTVERTAMVWSQMSGMREVWIISLNWIDLNYTHVTLE